MPSRRCSSPNVRRIYLMCLTGYELIRLQASLVAQGLKVKTMVRFGDPASEILSDAERQPVDLIMINLRGGDGATSPF